MLLHEHFQERGETEERTVAKVGVSSYVWLPALQWTLTKLTDFFPPSSQNKELGPLAEKAILKYQMMGKDKKQKNKETPPHCGVELAVEEDFDDRHVKDVLANPNLRSLLEDKELQRVGANSSSTIFPLKNWSDCDLPHPFLPQP